MPAAARIAIIAGLLLSADAAGYDDPLHSDPTFGGYLQIATARCAYVGAAVHRWRFKIRAHCGVTSAPSPAVPFTPGRDGIALRVGVSDVLAVAAADPRLTFDRRILRFGVRTAAPPRSSARVRSVTVNTRSGALTALVDFRGSILETMVDEWAVPVLVTIGSNDFSTTVDFAIASDGRRWVERPDVDEGLDVVAAGVSKLTREEFVLRDDAAWADAWRRHTGAAPNATPPGVDFTQNIVIGVTGPQFGHPLWIEGVEERTDRVIVHVRHGIEWGCVSVELPWLGVFVRIPTTNLPVEFDHRMRWVSCLLPDAPKTSTSAAPMSGR